MEESMASTGWKEKDDRTITEIRHYLHWEKLDAFIPWKPAHLAYLTNYCDMLHLGIPWEEMIALVVIPRVDAAFIVGEDWLIAGAEELGVAPRWLGERHPTKRPGRNAVQRVADLLREKGFDRGRIGVEYKWMPVAVYDHLRSALPNAEFVPCDLLVPRIRFMKTEREQRLLQKAAEIGLRAMQAYMRAVRSGATRREAERVRAECALADGGEWVGGPYRLAWNGGTDETPDWWDPEPRERFLSSKSRNWRGLPDDSPFFVTHFQTRFQYYFADMAWHQFFDPEPDDKRLLTWGKDQVNFAEARRDFEILRRVQREALDRIRPGMSHPEAKKMVDDYLSADREAKEHVTNYYIHGIGLEIHEEPVLCRKDMKEILIPLDGPIHFQPGAVVSSEWFSSLWTVEEPFVLTGNGWQPLVDLSGLTDPSG